jgi:alpha/beta superfamily hydrolase
LRDEQVVTLSAGGVELEGRLREGDGTLAAVVLHPHPQYGGDMNNHVVVALCDALAAEGASTLRFNFRGTGRSSGAFDNGQGEAADARAAVALMRERAPDARLVLAGYSFGAMIAAAVAGDESLTGLVLVSPPVGMAKIPAFPAGVAVLVAAGERDPISPAAAVEALGGPHVETLVVADADHSWWPGVDAVGAATAAFVRRLLP